MGAASFLRMCSKTATCSVHVRHDAEGIRITELEHQETCHRDAGRAIERQWAAHLKCYRTNAIHLSTLENQFCDQRPPTLPIKRLWELTAPSSQPFLSAERRKLNWGPWPDLGFAANA